MSFRDFLLRQVCARVWIFHILCSKDKFFLSPCPVVKVKVNIQTWGRGNNKPTLFYPAADCCFCQLASLREPTKLSSLSIFIQWHSALRQLEVQAQQASEGRRVAFSFPSFAPPAAEMFLLTDSITFPTLEVLEYVVIWRGWKLLSQKFWRGTSAFVIWRWWSQPPKLGVELLWCCCWTDWVTMGRWNSNHWGRIFDLNNKMVFFVDQVKVRNAKSAISWLWYCRWSEGWYYQKEVGCRDLCFISI